MGFNSGFKGLTLNHDAWNHEFEIDVDKAYCKRPGVRWKTFSL